MMNQARSAVRIPTLHVGLLLVLAFGAAASGFAQVNQDSPKGAQLRSLNNALLRIHGQMQQAAPNQMAGLRSQAATVIAQRATALTSLIPQNPHEALSFAFSPELLADLATKFPQSAPLLESHTTVRGQVEHWIEDGADLKTSRSYFLLKAGGRTLTLHFAGPEPILKSGELLQATGVVVGSEMAVLTAKSVPQSGAASTSFRPNSSTFQWEANLVGIWQGLVLALPLCGIVFAASRFGAAIRSAKVPKAGMLKQRAVCGIALLLLTCNPLSSSAQTCSTTGVQNVAVLLVSFSDVAVAVTPTTATNIFFGNDGGVSLNGYWQETSYGQTSATGDVFPVTIGPQANYSCSTDNQIFLDAVAAASVAGINLSNYTRIDVIFPSLGCFWAGITSTSNVGAGCAYWSTAEGTLTASLSMLQDAYFSTRSQGLALVTHENGHQLTLGHSGTISYEPTAVLPPNGVYSGITSTDMNDDFSTMGNWVLGHYVAQHQAELLNWLTLGSSYQYVQNNGTYTLEPLETSPAGLKALKVLRGTGNTGYYVWIEYRQPVGNYDSTIGFMNFNGALVHFEFPTDGDHTYVTDFTPSDVGTWYSTVLAPGQTWTDTYTDLSISVLGATATGLTVSVNYSGASSCISSAPSVSVSPLDPSIYTGQTAGYSVTVTDNDSSGCSSSTFNLSSSQPSGWTTSFSSSSLTLSPGQSASITMGKGAPSGTPVGTYAVNLSAASTTSSATGSANATVMAAPSFAVTVSTNTTAFVPPSTVSITALVSSSGTPISGASVTFTLTAPNGSTTTQTATTGTNGTATWNYKLNSKSLVGTYSVSAQAALSSGSGGGKKTSTSSNTQTATSNTVTFSVQ